MVTEAQFPAQKISSAIGVCKIRLDAVSPLGKRASSGFGFALDPCGAVSAVDVPNLRMIASRTPH